MSFNWYPYIPTDKDVQYSKNQDFEACGSYSATHIREMKDKKETGLFWEYSERYVAKCSDTQPWGNSLQNIVNALNQDGLCLVDYWPELTYSGNIGDYSWAKYYEDIPQEVKNKAFRVKASFQKLDPSQLEWAIEQFPLWTIIKTSGGTNHIVAQLNLDQGQYGLGQYYDSYESFVKDFQPNQIISQFLLTINLINMPNSEFIHKQNSQEYGFYLPALSEDALKDKAMNLGINILNSDGTINYTLAKEIQGL